MRWWYSHLIWPKKYRKLKNHSNTQMFWNALTWYHFFCFKLDYYTRLSWFGKNFTIRLEILAEDLYPVKTVYFMYSGTPVIEVEGKVYKQEDGEIYELSYETPVK